MKLVRLALAASVLALSFATGTAEAQTVRILVGYPPGGAVDALGRLFADRLAEALGRTVVVDNRAGALGQIAATEVHNSQPDGNTLLVSTDSGLTLWPHTVKAPPYDTLRGFVPIAHVGAYDSALAVPMNVSARDFREWAELVKNNPKNAVYASPGAGSNQHFLGFMLGQAIGVPLTHVPYRGVQPVIADLLGGQVSAAVLPMAQLIPLAQAGKVKILAHSGGQRSASIPDVPTFKEIGYPALEVSGWYLIVAPAGTSPEIVARYHDVFARAMRTQEVRDRMKSLDLDIREMAPPQIAAKLKAEHERWRPIVAASGFSNDNR